MTKHISAASLAAWLLLTPALLAAPEYSVKTVKDTAPPKELSDDIKKLLDTTCIQLQDGKGTTLAEIWLRKEVPSKATAEQVKNGLTYREIESSTVLGAIRISKVMRDYKKQKLPEGVYTLRFGMQPEDGDHMGTAPYNEFALLCPAAEDKKPDLIEVKELRELSTKTTENHPGVLVLFPADKEAGDTTKLVSKQGGHWVMFIKMNVKAGDKKATLPLGLNLIGSSNA